MTADKLTIPCEEPYYSLIQSRRKTVEGRKGKAPWTTLEVGDAVAFSDGAGHQFNARVVQITRYVPLPDETGEETLRRFLRTEGLDRVLPGTATIDEGVKVYRKWWSDAEIATHGVLGIHVVPTEASM